MDSAHGNHPPLLYAARAFRAACFFLMVPPNSLEPFEQKDGHVTLCHKGTLTLVHRGMLYIRLHVFVSGLE